MESESHQRIDRLLILALSLGVLCFSSGCGDEGPRPVSLLRVVVDPAAVEDERLVLRGYLSADMHLYPSREMAERFDRASALQIDEPDEVGSMASSCSGESAELSGRLFRKRGASRGSVEVRDYVLGEVDRALGLAADGRHEVCWSADVE